VEVDTLDYTVTVGAQPALGLANDEWILHGYRLLPGENQIQANTPITVRYRPRVVVRVREPVVITSELLGIGDGSKRGV